MNYVGNHLAHYASLVHGKRFFYPRHKALQISMMGNGDLMTQVLKTEFHIETKMQDGNLTYQVVEESQKIVYFRSKSVLVAAGASQGIDPRVSTLWFPSIPREKIIPSDSFLKKDVYLKVLSKLHKLGR